MEQPPKREKKRCDLVFGTGGHEQEYVFTMYDERDERQLASIAQRLGEKLGPEWSAVFRGTRIEIMHRKNLGHRDDRLIQSALAEVLGGEYEIAQ